MLTAALKRFSSASRNCRRLAENEGEDYGVCMRDELAFETD